MTKLWFKAKRYGWGWYPSSWEGWTVISIYVAFIIWNSHQIDSYSHTNDTLINFIPETIIATLVLLIICYKKGEKPRWRWGDKE